LLNDNWHIGVDGTPCNCGFGKADPEAVANYREPVAKIGSWIVLSATPQKVLEMLSKDFSEKFDKQYPKIKDVILSIMGRVSEEAPESRWAWRWMVGYLKNITPTLMNNWQQSVNQNRITVEFPEFFKTQMTWETMDIGNRFAGIKYLKDRYHFKFDLNSYRTFKEIETAYMELQEEYAEREEYRRAKDEFKEKEALGEGWTSPVEYVEVGAKGNKWFVMPISAEEAELEGQLMRHCIASREQPHIHGIEEGRIKAYSVRDKEGIPWATFTLDGFGQFVHECYGRNDHAVRDPEQKIIENFLKEKFPKAAIDYMRKPEGERTGLYNNSALPVESDHPIVAEGLSLPDINYPQDLPELCDWLEKVVDHDLDYYYLDNNLFKGWDDEEIHYDSDDEGPYFYRYQGMSWNIANGSHLVEIGKQLENLAEQTDLLNKERRLYTINMIKGFCIAKKLFELESPSAYVGPLQFSVPFFQDVYNMYQEISDFDEISNFDLFAADEAAQSENPIGQETQGTQNLSSEDWQQILQTSENLLGWIKPYDMTPHQRSTKLPQSISPDFINYLREMAKRTDRQSDVNLLLSLQQNSNPIQIENFLNLVRERAGQSQQESIEPMEGQQSLFTGQESPWVLNTGLQTGMVTASTKLFDGFDVKTSKNNLEVYNPKNKELVGSVEYLPYKEGSFIVYLGYGKNLRPEQDKRKISSLKQKYPNFSKDLFKWIDKNIPRPIYGVFVNRELAKRWNAQPTGIYSALTKEWADHLGVNPDKKFHIEKVAYSGGPNPTEADRQAITTINPNVGPLDPKGKTQSPWYPEPDINTDENTEEDIHNTVMNSESFRNKTRQPTAKWSEEEFEKGFKDEKEEHWKSVGENEDTINQLVKDHLKEDPWYYTKLHAWESAELEDNQQKTIKKEVEKAKKEKAKKKSAWKFANQELENYIYQSLDQIENLLNNPNAVKQCADLAREISSKIFSYIRVSNDFPENLREPWNSLYVFAYELQYQMKEFEDNVAVTGYAQAAMSFFDEISKNIQEMRVGLQEIQEFKVKNSSPEEVMNDWQAQSMIREESRQRHEQNLKNWEPVDDWGKRYTSWKFSNEDSVFVDEVFSYLKENKAVVQAYHVLAPLGDIYVVGDVPRDVLLGKAPKSIELVAEIDHNTIDYMLNQIPDARVRPDRHSFNFDLNNDSVRVSTINDKDFTADSLMIDLKTGEIIDPSGAMMDINQGVLHHVNPEIFADDPTKMLKALIMYSDHALHPSDEMKIAMAKDAHLLGSLPEDEIRETLDGILQGKRPAETIRLAEDAGLLQHLIPELSQCFGFDLDKPNQVHDLGTHLLDVLQGVSAQTSNENARLAALLHDIAKPKVRKIKNNGQVHYPDHPAVGARIAENIMKRLRYPANRINYVTSLIYHHKFNDFNSPAGAHHYLSILGGDIDLAYDLLSLRQADREDKVDHGMVSFVVNNMRKILNDEIKTREIQLDELNINEYDVARTLGIKGEEVHNILQKILERVKEHPQLNTRSELMELVRGMK
jgi:tRNA nucleotidyltransferase (CCA-adding enzyme)